MKDAAEGSAEAWADAVLAAVVLALDPAHLGGACLRARAGPVRDRWCALFRSLLPDNMPYLRLPIGVTEDRLLGGLDLAATLGQGRVVAERGVLASADGGVLVAAMAERLDPTVTAHLNGALDRGTLALERDGLTRTVPTRFGLVALDEGLDAEEQAPLALRDRLAIYLDLDPISPREVLEEGPSEIVDLAEARALLPKVSISEAFVEALTSTAWALGIGSLRAPILAARVAKAAAAIAGRTEVEAVDAEWAARWVLGPRATRRPAPEAPEEAEPEAPQAPPEPEEGPSEAEPGPTEPEAGDAEGELGVEALQDLVLAAAESGLPADLLGQLAAGLEPRRAAPSSGTSGTLRSAQQRGRRAGVRAGALGSGQRLNVVETLRAAAPWQALRRRERPEAGTRVQVRAEDFRINRYQERSETTTIFAVDASGSAALQRLAEAKGAVEQVLADCYVRRDNVALLAFRGTTAELLLPPTRSLVRAKRSLAGLPGGGATPLAAGIEAALRLALDTRRRGGTPLVVLMSDGRANVTRDGRQSRAEGEQDALRAARGLAAHQIKALFIDTSVRAHPAAQALALAMGARYLPLPYVDPAKVALQVRALSNPG